MEGTNRQDAVADPRSATTTKTPPNARGRPSNKTMLTGLRNPRNLLVGVRKVDKKKNRELKPKQKPWGNVIFLSD